MAGLFSRSPNRQQRGASHIQPDDIGCQRGPGARHLFVIDRFLRQSGAAPAILHGPADANPAGFKEGLLPSAPHGHFLLKGHGALFAERISAMRRQPGAQFGPKCLILHGLLLLGNSGHGLLPPEIVHSVVSSEALTTLPLWLPGPALGDAASVA